MMVIDFIVIKEAFATFTFITSTTFTSITFVVLTFTIIDFTALIKFNPIPQCLLKLNFILVCFMFSLSLVYL